MCTEQDRLLAEFINYVSKMAEHTRIDYLRRIWRREKHEVYKSDLLGDKSEVEQFSNDINEVDDRAYFEWFISSLTPEEQRVIYFYIIEGRTVAQISAYVKKSERWIRTVKSRALAKLRQTITEGEFSEFGEGF